MGLHENTVIILTSDNGYFLGERGFAGKWLLYEPSIRVPLIICDPRGKVPASGIQDHLVVNLDIAPTILDLAGSVVPSQLQGRSLLPLLRGRSHGWRNEVFLEHLYDHPRIPKSEGVRTKEFKYIRYPQIDGGEELYYLRQDTFEERNLVGDPVYAKHLLLMRRMCNRQIDRITANAPWSV